MNVLQFAITRFAIPSHSYCQDRFFYNIKFFLHFINILCGHGLQIRAIGLRICAIGFAKSFKYKTNFKLSLIPKLLVACVGESVLWLSCKNKKIPPYRERFLFLCYILFFWWFIRFKYRNSFHWTSF